jgi:hypothetical protein
MAHVFLERASHARVALSAPSSVRLWRYPRAARPRDEGSDKVIYHAVYSVAVARSFRTAMADRLRLLRRAFRHRRDPRPVGGGAEA